MKCGIAEHVRQLLRGAIAKRVCNWSAAIIVLMTMGEPTGLYAQDDPERISLSDLMRLCNSKSQQDQDKCNYYFAGFAVGWASHMSPANFSCFNPPGHLPWTPALTVAWARKIAEKYLAENPNIGYQDAFLIADAIARKFPCDREKREALARWLLNDGAWPDAAALSVQPELKPE
jgi:hypothetical protein